MKLRIRGNSIRLRLTKSEVAQFAETGSVEEIVEFGVREDQRFMYSLSISTEIDSVCAILENKRISVLVPKSQAVQWKDTNEIGIRGAQLLDDEKTLQLLIEKDFACLDDRPGEDDSDAFPHPEIGRKC
jgi:hypothetical protein